MMHFIYYHASIVACKLRTQSMIIPIKLSRGHVTCIQGLYDLVLPINLKSALKYKFSNILDCKVLIFLRHLIHI